MPTNQATSHNVVFVLGGPGSGKGTMCELAKILLGWTHLSTGELLRAAMASGGPTAATISELLAAGQLVPNEITVKLLIEAMDATFKKTGNRDFLLDGFPRSMDNMEGWYEQFGPDTELPTMLYLDCSYEILEQRILGRAKYTGRSDDNRESIQLRFKTFEAQTLPVVKLFRDKGKCITIDASQSRELAYQAMARELATLTDRECDEQPTNERAEMLLGRKPFPNE